jgi:hypothetical protein
MVQIMKTWYYKTNSEETIPISYENLKALVASGNVTPDNKIYDPYAKEWSFNCYYAVKSKVYGPFSIITIRNLIDSKTIPLNAKIFNSQTNTWKTFQEKYPTPKPEKTFKKFVVAASILILILIIGISAVTPTLTDENFVINDINDFTGTYVKISSHQKMFVIIRSNKTVSTYIQTPYEIKNETLDAFSIQFRKLITLIENRPITFYQINSTNVLFFDDDTQNPFFKL